VIEERRRTTAGGIARDSTPGRRAEKTRRRDATTRRD
jgi:hypothetical protein